MKVFIQGGENLETAKKGCILKNPCCNENINCKNRGLIFVPNLSSYENNNKEKGLVQSVFNFGFGTPYLENNKSSLVDTDRNFFSLLFLYKTNISIKNSTG